MNIIYLGRRGGGAQFTQGLAEALHNYNPKIILAEKNSYYEREKYLGLKGVPSGIKENFIFNFKYKEKKRLVNEVITQLDEGPVIFTMPHPLNFAISKKINQNRQYHVIHDAQTHAGDIWPSNLTIRRMCLKEYKIITLSKYTHDILIKKYQRQSFVLPILSPIFSEFKTKTKTFDLIFVGRHRKYKNYNLMVKAINYLGNNYVIYANLPSEWIPKINTKIKPVLTNEWLDETDFIKLISAAKCIVLTHSEASQSGLIPLATRLGTNVVAPEVGGLPEQISNIKVGAVYKPDSLQDLEESIKRVLSSEVLNKFNYEPNTKWLNFFKTQI